MVADRIEPQDTKTGMTKEAVEGLKRITHESGIYTDGWTPEQKDEFWKEYRKRTEGLLYFLCPTKFK